MHKRSITEQRHRPSKVNNTPGDRKSGGGKGKLHDDNTGRNPPQTILTGTAGLIAAPAIIGRAYAAATRGVTDTQITFGTMQDLSGVTAVQGVNNADAMRMVYDAVNAKGGIHGRKLNWVLEDMQYIVPKAVQAMNKMLNRDDVFFCIGNGGTPHNDAVMPSMFAKNVPNIFPLTCARSMYEPFNRLKFGQFSSVLRSDARRSEVLCREAWQETGRHHVSGYRFR